MYNFIKNFTILDIECFYYCIITVSVVDIYSLLLCLHDIFILCVIQPFLFLHVLLYFSGKLASKILRKACRKKLNLLLVSLSIQTDSELSFVN
jgi:hypothetical protein